MTAVALGACIVEKHLCLNRADGGPDAHFSLEPHEFAEMVRNIREAEASLGAVRYGDERTTRPRLPAIALRRRRRARGRRSPRPTCGRSGRRMACRPRSCVASSVGVPRVTSRAARRSPGTSSRRDRPGAGPLRRHRARPVSGTSAAAWPWRRRLAERGVASLFCGAFDAPARAGCSPRRACRRAGPAPRTWCGSPTERGCAGIVVDGYGLTPRTWRPRARAHRVRRSS